MDTSPIQMAKLLLMQTVSLSRDALHVYVGLIVLIVAALVMRVRIGALGPVLAVLAVACLGELMDLRDDLASLGHWRWQASLHDLVNTLFWPVVISVLARTRLFGRPPARDTDAG